MENFTLYVDESGEAGIGKIRSENTKGASPYMTLGAVLIPNRSKKSMSDTLEKILDHTNKKSLHCSQLNHYQLLHFARSVAARKTRFFGVISKKSTLRGYRSKINEDSGMYYNKCAQYLLERVGWFMEDRDLAPNQVDIVFEKANIDYGKMRNLLSSCQANPRHKNTKRLQRIDVNRITALKKKDDPILQVADLVAHALYKCVDKQQKNFGITEPRYLKELSARFFGDPAKNKILGAGLYCVHKASDLQLDKDVQEMLEHLEATPPQR